MRAPHSSASPSCGSAWASDLADFNAAAERLESHNRVALGYLRTGETDLASIEIDRVRAAWAEFAQRFSGKRPDMFVGNDRYALLLTDVSMRLVTADMMLNSGRPEIAGKALDAVRADFYDLRRSAGIQVLSDCIRDANTAMDALMAYNEPGPRLERCEDRAGQLPPRPQPTAQRSTAATRWRAPSVRQSPEFRRSGRRRAQPA